MEFLIELIVEILFEGVFEGAMEGIESKKVPMPLRILCGCVLLLVLVGIAVLFVVIAKSCDSVALWIFLMAVLAALTAGVIWKIVKVVRKRNGS